MVVAASGPIDACDAFRYFCKATPPMNPALFSSSYPARARVWRTSWAGGGASSCGVKKLSEAVDATRVMGGSVGGSCEELGERGRESGRGETSRGGSGCSRCATASQPGACSGRGDVGFDGARRWNRRCDSMSALVTSVTRQTGPCGMSSWSKGLGQEAAEEAWERSG